MADESTASDIQINVKGPSELKLQISISPEKTVLELKQAIAAKSDVEAERQRLIYSGRVLKDEDPLSVYKIQSAHTIHMVKGAARSGGASSSAASSTSQPLPNMQAGQNVHDPLTQLNSHLGFGAMAGINPFGDMGLNPGDPNMMQSIMNNPAFMQQMAGMLQNPQVLDQLIASNPQLRDMGPQVRQMFESEQFRHMVSDPQRLQQMMQMATMFQGAGGPGGGANPFAPPASFPAPGNPNASTPSTTSSPASTTGSATTPGAQVNPFNIFGAGAGAGVGAGVGAGAGGAPNPFGFDPAMMQQMLAMGNPFGAGAGAGAGGFGAPAAAPADSRPPEERFQVQLQQLQDMGFTNASQNVRALLATAGNVHSAIEYILNGGGI